jgi:hypothetical protein
MIIIMLFLQEQIKDIIIVKRSSEATALCRPAIRMFVLDLKCMFEDKLKCRASLFFLDKSTLDRRTHKKHTL